jgi:hypothetical protein
MVGAESRFESRRNGRQRVCFSRNLNVFGCERVSAEFECQKRCGFEKIERIEFSHEWTLKRRDWTLEQAKTHSK